MPKPIEIRWHPAQIVISDPSFTRFFLATYDAGLPLVAFANGANLTGGNPSFYRESNPQEIILSGLEGHDLNPRVTLMRELDEEFDPDPKNHKIHGKEESSVGKGLDSDLIMPAHDLLQIKREVLRGPAFFLDLLIQMPKLGGGRPAHNSIASVFYSVISDLSMDIVQRNFYTGRKRVLTEGEGVPAVGKIDDLVRGYVQNPFLGEGGRSPLAHLTAPILSAFTRKTIPFDRGLRGDIVPIYFDRAPVQDPNELNREGIRVFELGKDERASYADYHDGKEFRFIGPEPKSDENKSLRVNIDLRFNN
jgi:hypothetical protein